MTEQPQPRIVRKTDTQSLARAMFEDSLDVDQVKGIRDAAYKSGFAMAASIVSNYVRSAERSGEMLNASKLKTWITETKNWRNVSSLDDAPNIV
jgi:hypothetical protein